MNWRIPGACGALFALALLAGSGIAYATPPGAGDDDDDNSPQAGAPAAAAPAPAPLPVAAPAPAPELRPQPAPTVSAPAAVTPSASAAPVVTPTGPTSAMVMLAPSPAAAAPQPTYTAPAAVVVPAIAPAPTAIPQPQPAKPLPPLPAETAPPPLPPDPKIAELGGGIDRLRAAFAQHEQQLGVLHQQRSAASLRYYQATGDINARLSTGAVPNDQNLLASLQRAHQGLDLLQNNTDQLNGVSTALTDDSAQVLALAQQLRSELNTPAKSASDRSGLTLVEGRISAAQVEINQTLRNVQGELARENQSIAVEHQNLDLLAREIGVGGLVSDRALGLAGGGEAPVAAAYGVSATQPLAVIAGDAPSQSYEGKLYAVVSGVLKRTPGARFTVRAVTPGRDAGAKRALEANDVQLKADDVARTLATLGLSRARIDETEASDDTLGQPQVEVFVGNGP